MKNGEDAFPWHLGVFDAHCHPTDTIASLGDVQNMKARALTIMATREEDQAIVRDFFDQFGVNHETFHTLFDPNEANAPTRLVPSFGWHPWFSHLIQDDDVGTAIGQAHKQPQKLDHYKAVLSSPSIDLEFVTSLPEPRPLSGLLAQIRTDLEVSPLALVGEIGIDRSFRLPSPRSSSDKEDRDAGLTPGGREGRRLSPYRVSIDHQRKILTAQLRLAGQMQRPVSVHGVAAHGLLFDTLRQSWRGHEISVPSQRKRSKRDTTMTPEQKYEELGTNVEGNHLLPSAKPYPPRICLHSYSGPPDLVKQYLDPSVPATVFFSFSCLVNFSSRTSKAIEVVKAVPDDRILVESDLHRAGPEMDDMLEQIIKSVCDTKDWPLGRGVEQLALNWKAFVFGTE